MLAGIDFEIPPTWPFNAGIAQAETTGRSSIGPQPGWYAVSGSLLVGADGRLLDTRGRSLPITTPCFRWLLAFEPVTLVGGSIFVFRVTNADAQMIRQRIGLTPDSERE